MPVEILELIVRANVNEQPPAAPVAASGKGQDENSVQKQAIVEECVEQVLEILRRHEER